MLEFVIGTVRHAPPVPNEEPDAPNAMYEVIVSPCRSDPSRPDIRAVKMRVPYHRLQALLGLWAVPDARRLKGLHFWAPHDCPSSSQAFVYLVRVATRIANSEPMYLAYIANAFAKLQCPALDGMERKAIRTLFFDDADEIRRDVLSRLVAAVHQQSGGAVMLEEGDALEFVTTPPPPFIYLSLAREGERRSLLLRTDQHPPFVFDDEVGRSAGAEQHLLRGGPPEWQLIDLFNDRYADIFDAATKKLRDVALHRDVAALFSGSTGLAELCRGLWFGADGRLPRDHVLHNLDAIRASNKIEILRQALSELLDFLLFSAMESLSKDKEQELERRIQEILRGVGSEHIALPIDPLAIDLDELASVARPVPPLPLSTHFNPPPPPSLGSLQHMVPPHMEEAPSERLPPVSPMSPRSQQHEIRRQMGDLANHVRGETTFALERIEQLERVLRHDDEREAALRCREHLTTIQRELEELERWIRRIHG